MRHEWHAPLMKERHRATNDAKKKGKRREANENTNKAAFWRADTVKSTKTGKKSSQGTETSTRVDKINVRCKKGIAYWPAVRPQEIAHATEQKKRQREILRLTTADRGRNLGLAASWHCGRCCCWRKNIFYYLQCAAAQDSL